MLEVKVKANLSGLERKVGGLSKDAGLGRFAAATLERMMQPYVPERDSILIKTYRISPWHVTYTAPYARPMYYGVVKGKQVRYGKATALPKWNEHIDMRDFASQLNAYVGKVMK